MELNDKEHSQPFTLASVGRKIPFSVPDSYFEQVTDSIHSRVRLEEARFTEEEEFKLPEAYFDELSLNIEARVITEKLPDKGLTGGFTAPENYFEKLSERLHEKVTHVRPNTPVRRILRSWVSYAAAACVTIAIGTAVLLNGKSSFQVDKQLSKVSDQEIINYLQVHSTAADTPFIIEQLGSENFAEINTDIPEEELEQYLNNTIL